MEIHRNYCTVDPSKWSAYSTTCGCALLLQLSDSLTTRFEPGLIQVVVRFLDLLYQRS